MTNPRSLDERLTTVEQWLEELVKNPVEAIGTTATRPTPRSDDAVPTLWRGLSPAELTSHWVELGTWVEWLLQSYVLDSDVWSHWWQARGAVEQLIALHRWHHELVDVMLGTSTPRPADNQADNDRDETEHQRREGDRRRDLAHNLVTWHESLETMVGRLAGHREGGPLLSRAGQPAAATAERRAARRTQRKDDFEAFLKTVAGAPPATQAP